MSVVADKYELTIAHRVCPILAKTASHYKDKFEMVKATTASLARAIKGVSVRLVVILDGCDEGYSNLFDRTFGYLGDGYERIDTNKIGNHATYGLQLDVLARATTDSQFVYFSEDDYIYEENVFREMMNFLRRPGVDIVTPLDHPDNYCSDLESAMCSCVRVSDARHWKEGFSTCCTFMSTAKTFLRAKKSLSYYADPMGSDYLMGMLLTKKQCFSPRIVLGGLISYLLQKKRNWMLLIPAVAWYRLGLRLILAPRFRLWIPIPTLAVHLCEPSLPPFADRLLK